MPLGFQRLNERQQRPNANINFIKPLDGPDKDVAKDFLEHIAAQCFPVMQKDYISVMSLEEYEPNPEFLGRNFNAGEVIQLVLKDKHGRWLSFKFVQMVMMHELAHCKQMNHSRFFWAERNKYARQMEELWEKGYSGEGLWGRGLNLTTGAYVHDRMPENAQIPEHLCGGTYRKARGRKRKRGQDQEKAKETYAERQQKRIARKFGKHGDGNALGEDDLVRGGLERGKRHYGKPKVAQSKRGRELRANAALARFEQAKKQIKEETPELVDDEGSETESDDWYSDEDVDSVNAILRKKGKKIKDQHGNDMVKVCGDEGEEDEGAQDEMNELRFLSSQPKGGGARGSEAGGDRTMSKASAPIKIKAEDSETESEPDTGPPTVTEAVHDTSSIAYNNVPDRLDASSAKVSTQQSEELKAAVATPKAPQSGAGPHPATSATACPICSLENEPGTPTCLACSHVLKPSLMRNHWRCKSEACRGSQYVNAGDVGRCGLCGAQKPPAVAVGDGRAVGVISTDVLRWD